MAQHREGAKDLRGRRSPGDADVPRDAGSAPERTGAAAPAAGRPGRPASRIEDAVAVLEGALRAEGSPERAEQEKRYLKSALAHYGVTVPAIRRVTLSFLREGVGAAIAAPELGVLTQALWDRGIFDLRFAAVELLTARAGELGVADLEWLEPLMRRAHTWALIDGLAVDVLAPVLGSAPRAAQAVRTRWARDEDFWLRRAALLTLLRRLRAGDMRAFASFTELADPMLSEREFFIRKAIGWCLREFGKERPEELTAWLLPRAARASGVTVREAVRHVPPEQRERLLAAHVAPARATGTRPRSDEGEAS